MADGVNRSGLTESRATLTGPGAHWTQAGRSLAGACAAHMLHDGYTDQLYVLLPVWQSQFGLSYTGLALLRLLYSGTMGLLQIPGERRLERLDGRIALTLVTLVAAAGYLAVALSPGLVVLCAGLVLGGIGSSVQHPRGSFLVTQAYGRAARGPLGIYNFAGDLGKACLPALVAASIPALGWRPAVGGTAALGLVAAGAIMLIIPPGAGRGRTLPAAGPAAGQAKAGGGFGLLLAIGALDTAPRMGYLLFLPFLVRARGGSEAATGLALALLFIGGAFGKAACGWLGARLGVVLSVVATEAATALLIATSLLLPLDALLAVLPLLGIALNGTSSVLYGTVPDLAPKGEISRAFASFYTGVILMGGIAPIFYGALADHTSRTVALAAASLTAAAIVPLVVMLKPALARTAGGT